MTDKETEQQPEASQPEETEDPKQSTQIVWMQESKKSDMKKGDIEE